MTPETIIPRTLNVNGFGIKSTILTSYLLISNEVINCNNINKELLILGKLTLKHIYFNKPTSGVSTHIRFEAIQIY